MLRALLALLMCAVFVSCSDSLYENITSDSSQAAKETELELALYDKDYSYVIRQLENADDEYENLSLRKRYLLQSAWLGSTGFDMVSNVANFFEDNITATTALMSVQLGGNDLDMVSVRQNTETYLKVIAMTLLPDKDRDIQFAAGIAASMNVLMALTSVALELDGGSGISFNEEDPNYIGNLFNSTDNATLEGVLTNIVDSVNGSLDYVADAVDSLGDDAEEIADKLQDYIDNLQSSTGEVTSESILGFIRDNF